MPQFAVSFSHACMTSLPQTPAVAHYNLPALVASVRSNVRTVDHIRGVNSALAAAVSVVDQL